MEIQKHNSANSQSHADQAWTRINTLGLTATPETYTLFYAYYEGDDASLRHAVDRSLANPKADLPADILKLYNKHVERGPQAETVAASSSTLAAEMQSILATIEAARSGIDTYGSSLKTFNEKLIADISIEQIRYMVTQMALETRAVAEQNQNLQQQLSSSSSQVNSLRSTLETTQREVMKDALTGIGNRKAFTVDLTRLTQDAEQRGESLSLLMIDIDHFKNFNDKYGHLVGDQVLKLVAHNLKQNVKGRDAVARWGGEEFAILLPQTQLVDSVTVGDHLRELIASKKIIRKEKNEDLGTITLSIGATQYIPGEEMLETIERADKALYKAKQSGRNRVVAADQPAVDAGSNNPRAPETATITVAE